MHLNRITLSEGYSLRMAQHYEYLFYHPRCAIRPHARRTWDRRGLYNLKGGNHVQELYRPKAWTRFCEKRSVRIWTGWLRAMFKNFFYGLTIFKNNTLILGVLALPHSKSSNNRKPILTHQWLVYYKYKKK